MQLNNVSSMIFTPVKSLPGVLGETRAREEILQQILEEREAFLQFNKMSPQEQEALLEFCMGNRSLKITYDPFFHNIFDPIKHPERLSRFLSAILDQEVIVRDVLPREGVRLSGESSLMIMDILVETTEGTLIDVEMQKIGYKFPVERAFCYGSDLLVRQYDRTKTLLGKTFSYKDIRPVYIIVLMEKSPFFFWKCPDTYIHHSIFQLDSGLSIENLLNFTYIPLDIFLNMPHNEFTELEAWLYFLSSDNPLHIQRIVEKYPFFKELYEDIIRFRYHPEELIAMYSEALLIADRNTVKLMVDEMRQENDEMRQKNDELRQEYDELRQKNDEMRQKNDEMRQKNDEMRQKNDEMRQKNDEMRQKNDEMRQKNDEMQQKNDEMRQENDELRTKQDELQAQIEEERLRQDEERMQMTAEIERLKALLAQKNKE